MTNLTGEYDVVAEVGVSLLNGILGAVHENQDRNYPMMPHSLNLFIDDTHHGDSDPIPASERTGIRSRIEVQVSTPTVSLPVDSLVVRPDFLGSAEGSIAARSTPPAPTAASTQSRLHPGVADPFGVLLEGIIVPPTLFDLPRVTARVRVRAWVRDATEPALPEFLDGDLYVTTGLVRSDVAGVGPFLTLDRTSGPLVAFQPAAGTDMSDQQRQIVASIVRNFIRADTDPATFRISLPPEVRHFDFKLQPEARRPSILVMFMLTDRAPGPGARSSVGAGLLPDGTDFAIAVGRDYMLGVLRSHLFQGLPEEYHYSKLGVSATVRPDFAGATFDLEPGRIVFSLGGDGEISWFGIDDHFTFTVRQAFGLQVVDGALEPVADDDPVVDLDDVAVGGDYIEGKARAQIREQRDAALATGASQLRDAFDVRKQLEKIISGINPRPAGVALTGVEIRPEGVLVPGTVALAASGPVVVGQVGRAGLNDALESWIPGGTVERFVWERFPLPDVRVEDHRFVTEAITGTFFGGFCLRVEGTRVTAGGGVAPVSGSACFQFSPVIGPVTGVSAAISRPLVPLTSPAADGGVRVIGHYDPWAPGRVPSKGHANLLLHFGSKGADETVKLLRDALRGVRKRDAAIMAVGVVRSEGHALARRLGPSDDVLVVEDEDGQWARAFDVSDVPATVIVGQQGEVAWRDTSAITAKKLAAAIDKHAKAGGEVAMNPIRLAIGLNERPPDVPLRLADGSELSLRRLKGRPIALTFWTSRSEPSLDHLEFLREMQMTRGRGAPVTIAVGDGESPERVARILKEKEFPFLLLPDPDRRVSRMFGVWCWPCTVWIRPDQRVEAIDFGAAPPATPSGKQPHRS
jgi:peroxiredoxin